MADFVFLMVALAFRVTAALVSVGHPLLFPLGCFI